MNWNIEGENILYWADESSQGRTKISFTGTKSPTNQPRKNPFHLYSYSPHLPVLTVSRGPPLSSLSGSVLERELVQYSCVNKAAKRKTNFMVILRVEALVLYWPVAKFISPWLGDLVDSGIGLSFHGTSLPGYVACGSVRQPYVRVDNIPQSGTKNLATGGQNCPIQTMIFIVKI